MTPVTVLIVGSDLTGTAALVNSFSKRDYSVVTAFSGRQAVLQAKSRRFDLIIVDTTAPRLNYKNLCRRLRGATSAPLVLISAPGARIDSSLAMGGVLTKPVQARRLVARVKACIEERPPRTLTVGHLTLDLENRRLVRGVKSVSLTPKEFHLLNVLMARPGQTISRKTLMKEVWDTDYLGDTRTLDVHVRWVREKVEEDPSKPSLILTIRGQGYKFKETGE